MTNITSESFETFETLFPEGITFVDNSLNSGALFFPDEYDATIGKKSTAFVTSFGPIELKPLLNSQIRNFLNNQESGSTDTKIPFYGIVKIDEVEKMLVVCEDHDTTLLIMEPSKFDKKQVLEYLIENHLCEENDENDY